MRLRRSLIPVAALALCGVAAGSAEAQRSLRGESAKPLQFSNGNVTLNGWIELPANRAQNVPVVVLVGGNSPSWRGYDWMFRVIADSLLKSNIGVLYYDHRGDGASQGSWAFSTYEELADDVAAAAQAAALQPGVDAARVGVWGHSMGGWVAPLAAARSTAIAFVITAAGPGVSPMVQTAYDHMNQDMARPGITREDAIEMDLLRRDIWTYITQPSQRTRMKAQKTFEWARGRPWFSKVSQWRELQGVRDSVPSLAYVTSAQFDTAIATLRRDAVYDPASAFQRVHVPMLALFGGADRVVPNEMSIAAMRTGFAMSGNKALTTHVFPGAGHSLMTSNQPSPESFAAGYIRMMIDFINGSGQTPR